MLSRFVAQALGHTALPEEEKRDTVYQFDQSRLVSIGLHENLESVPLPVPET